jgi:hypothetical protein
MGHLLVGWADPGDWVLYNLLNQENDNVRRESEKGKCKTGKVHEAVEDHLQTAAC